MTKYQKLVEEITKASDEGVTIAHAEKVAALALVTMNELSELLTSSDKDRRMRKQGFKAIRAAILLNEIKSHEKKPTESVLEATVQLNDIVRTEETAYDTAEADTDELTRQFNIAKESHIYFRGASKGSFNG
jgi:hypothetical protein